MKFKEKIEQLQREKAQKDAQKLDPSKEKEEWINSISSVYDKVTRMLSPYGDSIIPTRMKMELEEESLGKYQVEKLTLRIGNYYVILEPYGAILIGAWGRIDVYRMGARENGYMLLKFQNPTNQEFYWEFRRMSNTRERIPFSDAGLEEVLNALVD